MAETTTLRGPKSKGTFDPVTPEQAEQLIALGWEPVGASEEAKAEVVVPPAPRPAARPAQTPSTEA